MDLTAALTTAIGALTAALVALFWLYVRQRDTQDKKFESFYGQMLPLLTDFKNVAVEMKDLIRKSLESGG